MSGIGFLCPGQGTQHRAMFDLLAHEPAAGEVMALLSTHLGQRPERFLSDCTDAELTANRTAQLLLLGHALALRDALASRGFTPALALGYSVGEVSASAVLGALDPASAFELVLARAEAMERAATLGPKQAMAALIGLSEARAQALAEAHGVYLAIVNGPQHVVAGGETQALELFCRAAETQGAQHVRRIAVAVASHTPLMQAAVAPFARALDAAPWRPMAQPLISGLDGQAHRQPGEIVELLARQLCTTLRIDRALESLSARGLSAVIEIGPGQSMAKLTQDACPGLPARSFDDFRSIDGILRWMERQSG